MIDIDNITFAYRKREPVLEDFSLRIPSGGIYGLLGRNGAGKSTLLYLIAGLLTPQKGTVTLNGNDTRQRVPSTTADIFIVPEEFRLPSIPLGEYVGLHSRFYPDFSAEDLKRHLATFDMSADLNLGQLSMGQKKKAFMSFALACNTPVLLLDEPTNGLDIPGKSRFRKFIVSAMNQDRTVVISTHQVRDIDTVLDHVVITDNRRVLLDRPTAEITSRLRFVTTGVQEEIEEALFSRPSIEGADIVAINSNPGFDDTPLNLESLFEFALSRPDSVNTIFNENINNK